MEEKKYNVLIIGAGKIAALYDLPSGKKVLSHAHAVISNPKLKLMGFVDIDYTKASRAASIWGGDAFASLEEVTQSIDIICCATSDKAHYETLKKAIKYNPKAIVAEKPFTETYSQSKELYNLMIDKKIAIEVNYSRRFIKDFIELKKRLKQMGKLLCGSAFYGKGLLHNGSHLLNLLLFLFSDVSIVQKEERFCDFSNNDKSYLMVVRVDDAEVYIQPINSEIVTVFELDLLFENGRVKYCDESAKIELYYKGESEVYSGEINYQLGREIKIDSSCALINLYDNIVNVLENNGEIVSSVEDAIKVVKLCT